MASHTIVPYHIKVYSESAHFYAYNFRGTLLLPFLLACVVLRFVNGGTAVNEIGGNGRLQKCVTRWEETEQGFMVNIYVLHIE